MRDLAAAPVPHGPAITAKVSKGGMEAAGVEVLDLSLAGCMLHWNGWRLQENQRVLVSFPRLSNLPATVLWTEQNRIGLLFAQPLHEAVYDHLIRS